MIASRALAVILALPAPLLAQGVRPGGWDITSTTTELVIPGAPDPLLQAMRGRSRTERRCLTPEQARAGPAALFDPDPQTRCAVDRADIAGGRIRHIMLCPQKSGPPLRIERAGRYGATALTARMTMTGATPKGAVRIVADQVAARTGTDCR